MSVEAPKDLRLLVPSLRAVSFHEEVYTAIGLDRLAATVGHVLQRLEATVGSELTSIESIERRADEDRRLRWSAAVGAISAIAIPISLILAFLGINASQVDPARSMFDPAYVWAYAGVGLLAVIAATLAILIHTVQLRQRRARTARGVRTTTRQSKVPHQPVHGTYAAETTPTRTGKVWLPRSRS